MFPRIIKLYIPLLTPSLLYKFGGLRGYTSNGLVILMDFERIDNENKKHSVLLYIAYK